jgi:hypothetical protein
MPGPIKKPRERSQRHEQRPELVVHKGGLVDTPPVPRGLLKVTIDGWFAFWSSDLARVVDPQTDGMAISRLFTLYDERERAYRD